MIFSKKEINSHFNTDEYIVVNKKEVDKVLNNKDFTKFKTIFHSVPINSILYAVNEKHRLEYLVKKYDLKFIDTVFDFFDKNKDENYHQFSDSVYTKSTDKQFAFKIEQTPIDIKFQIPYRESRTKDIQKFKRKVMAKVFHYNDTANADFVLQSLNLLKRHDLIDDYMVRKLATLVLKSNFENNHNQVVKHNLFTNKKFKKEYISYVFQASTNTKNLDILMKDFEEDIREIFFEKTDNNDFWFDLRITKGTPEEGIPYCYSVRPWSENTNKLIWLEKNHLGFSNSEIPYYIEFLKFFNSEELENFLDKVDRQKYVDMLHKSIKEYEELSNNDLNTPFVGSLDIKNSLLRQLNHREWDSQNNFYNIVKNVILKSELEQNLENKETPKKIKKI